MEPVERTEGEWADDAPAEDSPAEDSWDAVVAAIVADGPLDVAPLDPGLEAALAPDDSTRAGLALVRSLRDTDPTTLSAADAIAYLRASERAIAWLGALQATALVSIAGPRSRTDHYEVETARVISIEDADRSEIAAATRWSEPWADTRIATARLLAGPLADTARALLEGTITSRHADVICAAVQRMAGYDQWAAGADMADPDDATVHAFLAACAALESAVLEGATTRDVSATRRSVERALLRIDAAHIVKRRQAELRKRDVYLLPEPDGMALLIARMAMAQAQACLSVIDGVARDPRLPLPTDESTHASVAASIGERRAEALAHLVLGGTTAVRRPAEPPPMPGHPPGAHARRRRGRPGVSASASTSGPARSAGAARAGP